MITRVRNGRAKTVTGSKGSVIVGQRLISGRNGLVLVGGQTGGCCGRLRISPNDWCGVVRDIHWSS